MDDLLGLQKSSQFQASPSLSLPLFSHFLHLLFLLFLVEETKNLSENHNNKTSNGQKTKKKGGRERGKSSWKRQSLNVNDPHNTAVKLKTLTSSKTSRARNKNKN